MVVIAVFIGWAPFKASTAVGAPAESALILYDSSGETGWVGGLHAQLLANLLGHFELDHVIQPVEQYVSGQMEEHHSTFYFGTVFDNPLPHAFLVDAALTDLPLCWFNYNLWQLNSTVPGGLTNWYGFQYNFVDTSGIEEIRYKGESFFKDLGDPDLGNTTVTDTNRVIVPAMTYDPVTTNTFPYVLQSDAFWFVADSPFSFLSEEDRYIIITDLLHDILDIPHEESHSALIRLEDIAPDFSPQRLKETVDLLTEEQVPFMVSVIPVLEDPLGVFGDGEPRHIRLTDSLPMIESLQYAISHGGQILLHGYTHQYRDIPNPSSGLSGDDYEFFRVEMDEEGQVTTFEPLPEDSTVWVQNRLDLSKQELAGSGLSSVGWVTPHYAASALDYGVIATQFERSMERGLYFDSEGRWASQIYPYLIHRDIYGQTVYPENLGHVAPTQEGRTVDDLLRIARKTLVIRDGWAAGFFHPFLDLEELRTLVRGLKDLGYQFVPYDPPTRLQSVNQIRKN